MIALFLATFAFASATFNSGEATPSGNDVKLCQGPEAEIKAIRALRERAAAVRAAGEQVSTNIESVRGSCNAFKSAPNGDARGSLVQEFGNLKTANDRYKGDELLGGLAKQLSKVRDIVNALGGTNCARSLQAEWQYHVNLQKEMETRIKRACDMNSKAMRAVAAAEKPARNAPAKNGPLNNAPLDKDTTLRRALLHPNADASTRSLNRDLLKEAATWGATQNPPINPMKSARDQICGEACVAVLNAKRLAASGAPDWQVSQALQAAQNTKLDRYGVGSAQ